MARQTEISPLESHLGYWMRYVSNHVSHAFSLKLATRGVTVAEWVVLRELHDAESAPSALADRLIVKGLIVRRANDGDRRFQSLALTRAGRAATPKLAALADENDREFFADLDSATREAIATAMKDIVRRKGLRGAPVD